MKRYSVNKAPGTGLMITKIPPSVPYSRFLILFLPFHLCGGGGKLQEGPGRGKPHGSMVCQFV